MSSTKILDISGRGKKCTACVTHTTPPPERSTPSSRPWSVRAFGLRQSCAAVAHLHGCRVCHRDLKLDNMVYATVKLSPRRGALNGFDAANAETMRGVSKVMEITDGVAVVADTGDKYLARSDAKTDDDRRPKTMLRSARAELPRRHHAFPARAKTDIRGVVA